MSALQSERYWLGRLSMALAMAPRFPEAAEGALKDYVHSKVVTPEQRDRLREEMAHARHNRRK